MALGLAILPLSSLLTALRFLAIHRFVRIRGGRSIGQSVSGYVPWARRLVRTGGGNICSTSALEYWSQMRRFG